RASRTSQCSVEQDSITTGDGMNSLKFLHAAYIATWLIHGLYLESIRRRYSRLRQQLKDLERGGK
ncbi:MAG: hypothetical protein WB776_13290, partial [Candidatus Sulfotelmatobacter sp.]